MQAYKYQRALQDGLSQAEDLVIPRNSVIRSLDIQFKVELLWQVNRNLSGKIIDSIRLSSIRPLFFMLGTIVYLRTPVLLLLICCLSEG